MRTWWLVFVVLITRQRPSEAVAPGSPLQFVGVGYNLLKGNIDGGTASKGALDPGLLLTRQILQISPRPDGTAPEVVYQPHVTCSPVSRQTLIYNGDSYQRQLLKSVVPTEFKDVVQATEGGHHVVYHDNVTECSLATVRYNEDLVTVDNFNLTRSFEAAVCSLPTEFDLPAYMSFLDHWGTHVVMKVELGTRSLQRYQTTKAGVFEHVRKYDSTLISGSSEASYLSTSMVLDAAGYPTSIASHTPLGSLHYSYTTGTVAQPEPIGLTLVPISEMLQDKYWRNFDAGFHETICGNKRSNDLSNWRNLIQSALKGYANYTHATAVTGYKLQLPVTWPSGTYGLMKAAQGCPGGVVPWLAGWRYQDTEDSHESNSYSSNINHYLAGEFGHNVKTEFCLKGDYSVSPNDLPWAPGTYCILKYRSCPQGFSEGYVSWDDEDDDNGNSYGGTLPDGTYDRNTKIFYCCRDDGPGTKDLFLPTSHPFVLLKYKGHCQAVRDMHVQEVFIHFDDEDDSNANASGGAHPLDDCDNRNHCLHFCYYSTASSGSAGIIG